jgi:hypothetical protein
MIDFRVLGVAAVLLLLVQLPSVSLAFDSLPTLTLGSPHVALLDLVKGLTVSLSVLRARQQPDSSQSALSALPAVWLIRVAGGSLQATMLAQSWSWLHSPVTVPSIVVSWAVVFLAPSFVPALLSQAALLLELANCAAAAHTITTSAIDVVLNSSTSVPLRQSLLAPVVIALVAACTGRVVGDALGLTAKPNSSVAWTPVLRVLAVSVMYLLLVQFDVLTPATRRALVAVVLIVFSLANRGGAVKESQQPAKRKKQ